MRTEQLEISVNNEFIRGSLYIPEGDKMHISILFLHGWTGRPNDNAASSLAELGYPALAMNMRGHGNSDGDIQQVSAVDSLADAQAAYDVLNERFPDNGIVLVGNSYGAYVGVLLSTSRHLMAMSLRVPATYPDELYGLPKWGRGNDDPGVAAWRQTSVAFGGNRAFQLLHEYTGEVQIIEGELDHVIPHQAVQNYVVAVSDPSRLDYRLMKGWPHSIGDSKERERQFEEVLIDWLSKVKARV